MAKTTDSSMTTGPPPDSVENDTTEETSSIEEFIISQSGDKFVLSDNFGSSADPIRQEKGAFWEFDGNGIVYGNKNTTIGIEIEEPQHISSFFLPSLSIDLPTYSQKITISAAGSIGTTGGSTRGGTSVDMSRFNRLTETLREASKENRVFYDMHTALPRPIEYPSEQGGSEVPTIDGQVNYIYNYGNEEYENMSLDISEKDLANFYDIASRPMSKRATFLKLPRYRQMALKSRTLALLKEYTSFLSYDAEDFYITGKNVEDSQSLSGKKDNFPFVAEVLIDPGLSTWSADSPIKTDMMTYISDMGTLPTEQSIDFIDSVQYTTERKVATYRDSIQNSFNIQNRTESLGVEVVDVLHYLAEASKTGDISSNPRSKKFYNPVNIEDSELALILTKYQSKLSTLISTYTRTYDMILGGRSPYSEVLFYKIEKYTISNNSETLVQNMWVPTKKTKSVLKYLDTQIKYGQRYRYRIFAYKLVIGSEYKFNMPAKPPETGPFADEISNYTKAKANIRPSSRGVATGKGFDNILGDGFNGFYRDILLAGNAGRELHNIYLDDPDSGLNLRLFLDALDQLREIIRDPGSETLADPSIVYQPSLLNTIASYLIKTLPEISDDYKSALEAINKEIISFDEFLADLEYDLQVSGPYQTTAHGLGKNKSERQANAKAIQGLLDDFGIKESKLLALMSETLPEELGLGSLSRSQSYNITLLPSIKILKLPIYSDVGSILDNPPISPNVNIVTYKDVKNVVSPFLNSAFGKEIQLPIFLGETEREFFSRFREARKLNSIDPILFKSDEFENIARKFEVYRLDKRPMSYSEFEDNRIAIVNTIFNDGARYIPSASFKSQLETNKKYYYMFRTVDRRGITSNPSDVYEIEMRDTGGITYPIIQIVDMGADRKSQPTKPLQRLLNIIPNISQVQPKITTAYAKSYAKGKEFSDILGTLPTPLFGKKFKIRMTSKKTGKMVDLNITFDTETIDKLEYLEFLDLADPKMIKDSAAAGFGSTDIDLAMTGFSTSTSPKGASKGTGKSGSSSTASYFEPGKP